MVTEQVDQTIYSLSVARFNMIPAIPETWQSAPVRALRDPAYLVECGALDDVIVHWRDGGIGWRHFVLTRKYAAALGRQLIAAAEAPALEMKGRA